MQLTTTRVKETKEHKVLFYGSFNNILNVMGNSRNEMSALYPIQTYCLPSLLYSCETWYLNSCDMKRVEVAWNNAFRKIFNVFWYESIKPLQYYCSFLPCIRPDTHKEVILEENVV